MTNQANTPVLAQNIKTRLAKSQMSHREFARRLEVKRSLVTKICKSGTDDVKLLIKIADLLSCTTKQLTGEK